MMEIGTKRTIKPYPNFSAADDVQKWAAIVDEITNSTVTQHQEVKITLKTYVGKDLEDYFKSELTGNFEQVILGLITPSIISDVQEMNKAMKGAGTDEGCLIEILASRSTEEMHNIHASYRFKYGKSLDVNICSDASFMFQRVLVSLAAGGRDQSDIVDGALPTVDANAFMRKKKGTEKFGPFFVQETKSIYFFSGV
uniref:Annexin n=1 Tax=Pyxicephalus adspersus TaxID=30357 RepID=A0AAV2ZYW5_PYXAD|nr:TPA: hypothetical protein GDO54_015302 [Pyxicephalus adspersus]